MCRLGLERDPPAAHSLSAVSIRATSALANPAVASVVVTVVHAPEAHALVTVVVTVGICVCMNASVVQ